MIKVVFCVRRRAELSREEFSAYWRERHGPLVVKHAPALGIRRYVQSHTLDSEINAALAHRRGGPEPFEGVAELWWDDAAALAAPLRTPEGRRAAAKLIEDEARFVDLARSPIWVAQEFEVALPPAAS